tara:strand:- start:2011 stop:2682 length:672 start_codon:yes stop_codon:yes gene_type:complete
MELLSGIRGALDLLHLSRPGVNLNTAKGGYNEERWVANFLQDNVYVNQDRKSKVDIKNGEWNFQVKKSKKGQFQQVSRGTVDNLINDLPELEPIKDLLKERCEDKKEFKPELLESLNSHKRKIIEHALLGHGERPDILCVTEWGKNNNKREKITFFMMDEVIESLMQYDFKLRKSKTVIELGPSFTFQRKGGDGGRQSANDIQFKIVPSLLDVKDPVVIPLER